MNMFVIISSRKQLFLKSTKIGLLPNTGIYDGPKLLDVIYKHFKQNICIYIYLFWSQIVLWVNLGLSQVIFLPNKNL